MRLSQKQRDTLKKNNEESNFVTREAVQEALFLLMKEQDYEEIRITDIIKKSGISRSAFYRNYKTKDDVLRDHIGDLNALVLKTFSSDVEQNWKKYIRTIRENHEKIELLIRAHREWFLLDAFNEMADYSSGTDFVSVLPHGYIYNIVIYWVKCGMPGSDDEVTDRIMEACRINAHIMLSGIIPPEELEKTLAFQSSKPHFDGTMAKKP
ncbi:MAG: TetR/AcrR family transcriptional regulator [Oscillospiraceae bacterium]|nr:TetR/AcrR family transcriptional regulator [Oscillospiraceae bacterium]